MAAAMCSAAGLPSLHGLGKQVVRHSSISSHDFYPPSHAATSRASLPRPQCSLVRAFSTSSRHAADTQTPSRTLRPHLLTPIPFDPSPSLRPSPSPTPSSSSSRRSNDPLRSRLVPSVGLPVDPWSPNIDSQSIASSLFAASLLPYLIFLYFLTKSKTAPGTTLFGFYFLLAFVGATIPAGIYAKIHYGTSLSNVDYLHGTAESLLTVTNLLIVLGLRKSIRAEETQTQTQTEAKQPEEER